GTDALTADADCIAAVAAAIKELGVGDITIRINNRKILDGLFSIVRVLPAQAAPAMRLIDKLDKGDAKKTESEMETLGIPAKQLFKYLNMPVKDAKNLQSAFGKLVLENKALADGVGELATVLKLLEKLGVPNAVIDLKLVRGLDYYTGMICEILLTKLPALGSVGGGGRYDNLIGAMSGGKTNVPAVGMSIGIDRLIAGLEDLKVIKYDLRFEAIVFNLDASLSGVYSDIARELRASGIGCDLYYQADPMDKQFKYAEKKNIILGIFVGEDEIKKGTVTLKNLKTRAQWTVKAEKLAGEVEKALK
ncbi:MAG TPA: HisS family protein, partial [Patescibacteria group bacterium]|nr:HisS family protein [Patescibacteria group bacterium]